MNKKVLILIFFVIFLVITGCSKGAETEKRGAISTPAAEPVPVAAPEVTVAPKKEKEFEGSFIVVVDNHKNAYPHAGLDKADRVIEILAEGGITRFMAFFDSEKAEKIGPVRSARYYFVEIAKAYPSGFAHAGGNTDALYLIPTLKIFDIDEIYNAGGAFIRTKDRRPPHNLYTSTDLLLKHATSKKYPLQSLPPLPIGEPEGGVPATLVDLPYSQAANTFHLVTYTYEDGRYLRLVNGKAFYTEDKVRIAADNLIVMKAKNRHVVKEELQSEIEILGSGEAVFFVGGKAYAGSWSKKNPESDFVFTYQGKPMEFREGKTWIQVIPIEAALKYQ